MREIERSDNDALRAKKDIMEAFIRTRFYDLPDGIDVHDAPETPSCTQPAFRLE